MTIAEALKFAEASIDRREAQYLLANLLKVSRATLLAHTERIVAPDVADQFARWIAARAEGKPFAYIVGAREFYGREFNVNEHVLIPRPETEILVEQALERVSEKKWRESPANARVLDMGTGSGVIAITLALESKTTIVMACDYSRCALDTARINAQRLGANVEFIESNWYAALTNLTFHLIIANPPYVAVGDKHLAEGDLRFEPKIALTDGSRDGLDSIRTIVDGAPAHLSSGGWLLFEHGYDQADMARDLLLKAGFENLICINDLAGIPRVSGGQIR